MCNLVYQDDDAELVYEDTSFVLDDYTNFRSSVQMFVD